MANDNLTDEEMVELFGRIETVSESVIHKRVASWVLDLYDRMEEADTERQEMQDERDELMELINDRGLVDDRDYTRY